MKKGDQVVFSRIGAYNMTQLMQFIQQRPAVVMVSEQGAVEVIRAAESLDTVSDLEHLPSALQKPFPKELPE